MNVPASIRISALTLGAAVVFAACSSGGTPAPSAPASQGASTSGGAGASGPADCATGSITALGSTAMQPVVEAAAKAYAAACSGATVNVQGGGSGTGLTQVFQGAANIGDSDVTAESKLQADQASQLVDHVVLRQGWLMVTNTSVTGVTNLTTQQAQDIWTGKITNWKDVGGPDQAIVLILRPASSGTRATFKKIVLGGMDEATGQALTEDSNGAVTKAVQATPGSTSVIGFAYYGSNKAGLNGLSLDGVAPTLDDMANGTYKLSADGHMYTKGQPSGLTKSFIDYMLSPAVQGGLLSSLGYAPAPKS